MEAVLAFLQARHFAARADHRPKALHLLLHLVDKTGPIDAQDAGIVLDSIGVVDLSAGDHLFEDQRLEPKGLAKHARHDIPLQRLNGV